MIKTSNLTKNFEQRQNFDFEIWRFENRNNFKTNNIFNTIHFWFIVATLKCVRLILQFHRFINMCAKWKIVIENAMKIDVFEFLRLMFRSKKNFLIKKNEFFFYKKCFILTFFDEIATFQISLIINIVNSIWIISNQNLFQVKSLTIF